MAQLAVVIFGGPNGSGKSTITSDVRKEPGFPEHYINADAIAQELRSKTKGAETPEQQYKREVQAANEAEKQRLELIRKHESFCFETVMSHPSKVAIIDHAHANGYEVALYFVSTRDPQINVQRVAQRVQEGGHGVDAKKIVSRYHRALSLLPAAAERADLTLAFDNSASKGDALLVARVANRELEVFPGPVPDYYQEKFITPFQVDRPKEREQIAAAYGARPINDADLIKGRSTGEILAVNAHFVVQDHGRNVVVHDRAILDACKIVPKIGQNLSIEYKQGNAVSAERDRGRER